MDIFQITEHSVTPCVVGTTGLPAEGFVWIDARLDEIAADPDAWRNEIERITGVAIYDLHMTDAMNLLHPSYFDSTHDYEMVVFRKLSLAATLDGAASTSPPEPSRATRKIPAALIDLLTQPVTFFVTDRVLITVHGDQSRTIDAARTRMLEYRQNLNGGSHSMRLPASPQELMLRLLNAMVDQYLALRQPLTDQIDRWQRALLDAQRPFKDWMALLDARIALRKLDHLCEEQHDALQELRDHFVDSVRQGEDDRAKDLLLVRVNDVIEHVARVLGHARRLESSIESAVQIHFSAMSHRTSEIVRTLTVITALFMPLTLITGIFGMNFQVMPLLTNPQGFWLTMGSMAVIVIGLLLFFRRKHYLDE